VADTDVILGYLEHHNMSHLGSRAQPWEWPPGGGWAAPTESTVKSTRKGSKGGKKGQKH
jgi:hypothetical protein